MIADMSKEEVQMYTPLELKELGSLESNVADAMACQDYDKAQMYAREVFKIKDHVAKREYNATMSLVKKEKDKIIKAMGKLETDVKHAKLELKKEVLEVMKLPFSKRNEHYAKVKNEKGLSAAKVLVSEVKKHIRLHMGMER